MEVILGLIGLLMAAAGFMESLTSHAPSASPLAGVAGAILFAGGLGIFGVALLLNQIKRLRQELKKGFETRGQS